jgi:hypothetical protein
MAKCRCGATGDVGELLEHAISALANPEDQRVHGWDGETQHITQVRAARDHREATRRRIADQLGVSVAELREALR